MSTDGRIDTLVLQEFRLHAADTAGEAARIVASFAAGIEPAVPLLTSIDDRRDVATIRGMHAGEKPERDPREHAALDPLVASWQPLRRYGPRIAERSARQLSHYRLAVTESGINSADPDPSAAVTTRLNGDSTSSPLGLLWIGRPLESYAGLLTLVGSDDDGVTTRPDPQTWPLPFSRPLGVRIYESRR